MNRTKLILSATSALALALGLLATSTRHAQAETGSWGPWKGQCTLDTDTEAPYDHYRGFSYPTVNDLTGDEGATAVFCDGDDCTRNPHIGVSAAIRPRVQCRAPNGTVVTTTGSWSVDPELEGYKESSAILCPDSHPDARTWACQIKQ
jgi:hypothetical protein